MAFRSRARQRKSYEPSAFLEVGSRRKVPETTIGHTIGTSTSFHLSPLPEIRASTMTTPTTRATSALIVATLLDPWGGGTRANPNIRPEANARPSTPTQPYHQPCSSTRQNQSPSYDKGKPSWRNLGHLAESPTRASVITRRSFNSCAASVGGTRTDIRIRIPFKQHIGNLDYVQSPSVVRPSSSSNELSDEIFRVTEELGVKPKQEESLRVKGRLRKARLQPMKPVQVEGPSIEQCAGIVAETHYNPHTMLDPLELRRALPSALSPRDLLHWRDAAANLSSSSRRSSPLPNRGEDPLMAFTKNYGTTDKIDHEKIQAFRQYAASHRTSPTGPRPKERSHFRDSPFPDVNEPKINVD